MKLLSILILFFLNANASKILCIFPGITRSHYILGLSLVKALVKNGHEITFVSPFEDKDQVNNTKYIVMTGYLDEVIAAFNDANLFDLNGMSPFLSVPLLGNLGLTISERTLANRAFQRLLKSNENFNLVILENFVAESLQVIPHHYNVPSVLVSTIGPTIWTNHLVGIPDIPSFMANLYLNNGNNKMPFLRRAYNTALTLYQKLFDYMYCYPKHNEIIKKYFPKSPDIRDLIYNASILLTNSHVSFNMPVLTAPNMIEIGGYHVDVPKRLPDDLQKILDESRDGVIFFSMGSNLKSTRLYPNLREAVLKVFGKLNQTVLWKFENDQLPGKPRNVIIRKWFPQQDILAHPNVKLFITHGGLLSTIESVYLGVPIIAIPVFGDQLMNAATATSAGYCVQIPFTKLSEKTLSDGIKEILSNPSYLNNAKARSKIFHDQQVKPIDNAVYWIEYVIRHRGALHLKSQALNLNAFQYYMVDVILFFILAGTVLLFTLYICAKRIFGKLHLRVIWRNKIKAQ